MHRYGLLFISAFCLVAADNATGVDNRGATQLPKTPAALAAFAEREWVRPVLVSLGRKRDLDPALKALLGRVQIWSLAEPRPQWGPNAIAENKLGQRAIYIDLFFLSQIMNASDMVALALTGSDKAGAILYNVGEEYGKALGAAIGAGRPIPDVSFDRGKHLTDPALTMVVEHLSHHVMLGVVAWAILHEVAHHHLGHLDCRDERKSETCVRPATSAESRAWELDADAWAFKVLDSLGYGLYAVDGFLTVSSIWQSLRLAVGVGSPEASSTHPSFETRQAQLEKLYQPNRPSLRDVMVFLTVSEDGAGKFRMTETTVFKDPLTTGLLLGSQTGGVMLPFEWRGNSVHIFGRDQSRINEFIIHDAQAVKSPTTYRETLIASGRRDEVASFAIRVDAGWMQSLEYKGVPVSTILESSPRRMVTASLRTAGIGRLTSSEVETIHVDLWRASSQLMIDYCRGRVSAERAHATYVQLAQDAQTRIRQLLGSERYTRWQDALLTNPVMSLGLDEVLKRVR